MKKTTAIKRICAILLLVTMLGSLIPAASGADAAPTAQQPVFDAVSPIGKTGVAVRGTAEEVQTFFEKNNWTDGLPIVPPTDEKVQDYLRYTPCKASDVIVKSGNVTAYSVAVNAIMSGCPAQYMPVCIALAKACNDDAWIKSLKGAQAGTPFAWLNGPVARQLGIDRGQGMISEVNNKALARFLNLALLNMAGVDVNHTESAFGTVGAYVFDEDDEACLRIGWQPYHVTQGMDLDDSAVTVSTGTSWGNNLTPATPEAEKTMELIACDIAEKGSAALTGGDTQCFRTIFIAESVAANLAAKYTSKTALEDALFKTALRPFALRAYANYWADPAEKHAEKTAFDAYYNELLKKENAKETAVPDWYKTMLAGKSTIPTTPTMRKGETRILVTGDASRNKVQTMAGSACTTVKIELPTDWDALMNALSTNPESYYYYEPIQNFYLGKTVDTSTSIACGPEGCRTDMRLPTNTASASAAAAEPVYAVMSPEGNPAIERIQQAPRLDTLAGKRIALVGRSFNAQITQEVIKERLLKDYPGIKLFTDRDVGYAGTYSVLNPSEQTKEFQQKLKDYNIDAVVTGNCGCGLCTVKECGAAIAAEYIGVPAVAVGSTSFITEIHSTGVNRGVPVLRAVEYPGAFSSESVEALKQKAETIVYPALVSALTTQITQAEINSLSKDANRAYNAAVLTASYDEIQAYYRTVGWTDGLPIGLPTEQAVQKYLQYTPYAGSDVLGIYPVAYREARVYTVAVNAIMAGCPAEYMPLCIAFVKCMSNGEWRRPLTSTHGWSPYAWLNGPVARQLGFGAGTGMMNAKNNKKLARFIDLAMLNIGGYHIKENRMGTFGYLTPWVFAEDDQACLDAGWLPHQVSEGMQVNDNALTAASALYVGAGLTPQTDDAGQIKNLIAFDVTEKQQNALGNTNPQVYRTMCITPDTAKKLAGAYASKSAFEDALIDAARRPLWLRAYANYWANPGGYQYTKRSLTEHYKMLVGKKDGDVRKTEVPDWYKLLLPGTDELMTFATMQKGDTPILVTGDAQGGSVQIMPGGGYATVDVELPQNWDELTKALGYAPIGDFYLDGGAAVQQTDSRRQIKLKIGEKTAEVYGKTMTNDVAPVIRNGRTMLPARFVAEKLGATVTWDAAKPNEVVITRNRTELILTIGSSTAKVNGQSVTLDSPPFIENGRTYCPLRFICERLGARVVWNASTQEITITRPTRQTSSGNGSGGTGASGRRRPGQSASGGYGRTRSTGGYGSQSDG